MDDNLLSYYERELSFTRRMAAEFSKNHPKAASRLLLETDKCEDQHMDRLVQAFAFECAGLHQRIGDDFPEITSQMLEMVFPHFTRPIPSMSVARFEADTVTVPPSGYTLERNTHLFSNPVNGTNCQFQTVYPVTLWPVEVISAGLREPRTLLKDADRAISIKLKTCKGLGLDQMGWSSLRLHINGLGRNSFHIHELLLNHACHVEYVAGHSHGKTKTVQLTPSPIRPVGLEPEEAIIPSSRNESPGHRLLMEYFCFPEKFLFIDFTGLDTFRPKGMDTFELWIYLDRGAETDIKIDKNTFAVNCTPVINLFSHIAAPIGIEKHKSEYRLIPDDNRDATEIYRIDKVTGATPGLPDIDINPLYSLQHQFHEEDIRGRTFWRMERKPSGRKGDHGTDISLRFSDQLMKPLHPAAEQIIVHAECTNRDLPSLLPLGDSHGDLELETAAPVLRTCFTMKPTSTRRPSLGGIMQWQALSSLNPTFLPTRRGQEESLKEILRLYDFDDSPMTRRIIEGIKSVSARYVTRRIERSFLRGLEITIEFDKDAYEDSGLYLFSTVLEMLLCQYVSSNSYIQMIAKTLPDGKVYRTWPPRRGARPLL